MRNDLADLINKLQNKGINFNTVYDIGADKGIWTSELKKQLPKATYYLFEANPNKVSPPLGKEDRWFNVVLSSPDKPYVDFYNIKGTGDSYYKEVGTIYTTKTSIILPTNTLDSLTSYYDLPIPNLIKLDTQGSELDILKGADSFIRNVEVIVTELPITRYNEEAPLFREYINTMNKLGFNPAGLEGVHFASGILVQLDLVFINKHSVYYI